MKKLITLSFLLTLPLIGFSQSKQELLEVGIKPKLVNKIVEDYNGSITNFYESWSKKGKVHKSLVSSLNKLGYEDEYLTPLWKKSQRIRLVKIVGTVSLGVVGIGEGFYGGGVVEYVSSPNPNYY